MRFTILTQYYPPEVGAPQARLAAFATCLKRRGHDVRVVTALANYPSAEVLPRYKGKLWAREQIDGIPVVRTWIRPGTGRAIGTRLGSYLSFALSCLPALAQVRRADVVFVETPPLFLCLSGWLMSVLRGQRLCLNVSDLWPDSVVALGLLDGGPFVRAAYGLERWLYRQAWRVCGVTEGMVRTLAAKGVDGAKLLYLPNAVDPELFPPQPAATGPPYRFLYAGTHGYAHRMDVLLYAAAELRHKREVQFLLVGDGADKPRLQQLAAKLELRNLVFHDPVPLERMPSMLAQSYAAVVTVTDGPFFAGTRSAKILPAMASARPIVHSGGGEGADLIRGAAAGLVAPAGDATALAQAVLQMIDHPEEAAAMGRRGRALVEREYSWQSVVDRWLAELNDGGP